MNTEYNNNQEHRTVYRHTEIERQSETGRDRKRTGKWVWNKFIYIQFIHKMQLSRARHTKYISFKSLRTHRTKHVKLIYAHLFIYMVSFNNTPKKDYMMSNLLQKLCQRTLNQTKRHETNRTEMMVKLNEKHKINNNQ